MENEGMLVSISIGCILVVAYFVTNLIWHKPLMRSHQKLIRLQENSDEATATVTKSSMYGSRHGSPLRVNVEYEFKDDYGKPYTGAAYYDGDRILTTERAFNVGDTITILYDRNDPSNSYPKDDIAKEIRTIESETHKAKP